MGAALCMLGFAACSDDEEGGVAVGITAATVTPEGSAVAYSCTINGAFMENTNDSVDWDVTDAQLAQAIVTVTPTIGATVYYNGQPIAALILRLRLDQISLFDERTHLIRRIG